MNTEGSKPRGATTEWIKSTTSRVALSKNQTTALIGDRCSNLCP